MSWTRVGAVLPAVLAACANVTAADAGADAGSSQPTVASVDPQPGPVPGDAKFTVQFSAPMDEGQLVARTGQSETVVLTPEANVELAAAAIEHGALSAYERTLLLPAQPAIAPDRKSLTLAPARPLAGKFYLLVASRLKDGDGRRLAGPGARFAFEVAGPRQTAVLVTPAAGGDAPSNLRLVRAFAKSGRVSLHDPQGAEVATADAHGDVELKLAAPLSAGAKYLLALDGAEDAAQSFTVAPCAREAAPALEGGEARLSARDTSVTAELALDWPARVELQVGAAAGGDPCAGSCATASADVSCAAKACGPQAFGCKLSLRVDGLQLAQEYALRVVAEDDLGHRLRGPVQKFSTVAALPRLIIAEVMSAPPAPQGEAEYVEVLNQGPGVAVLDGLALVADDGTLRPLVAAPPPLPVQLAPGGRALAVGKLFDLARYPALPPGTPVLRASTQRLLGRGLSDAAPQAFRLVTASGVPVELARFPGGGPGCPSGVSLQRDESVPPDGEAPWACGKAGGTPGAPP